MAGTNITSAVVSPEEVRRQIVEGLTIGHLTTEEQDKIIGDLGAALLERATYAVLMQVPSGEFDRIDALVDQEGKEAEVAEAVKKAVPNVEDIIQESVRGGIEEYKILVNEQVKARLEVEEAVGR